MRYYALEFDPSDFGESVAGQYVKAVTTVLYEVVRFSPWELVVMAACVHYEFQRDKRTRVKSLWGFLAGFLYSRGLWVFVRGLPLVFVERALSNCVELSTVVALRSPQWNNEMFVANINRIAQWLVVSVFRYARLVLLFKSGGVEPCPWLERAEPVAAKRTRGKKTAKAVTAHATETYVSALRYLFSHYHLVLIAGFVHLMQGVFEDVFVTYGTAFVRQIDSYDGEAFARAILSVVGFTIMHLFMVAQYKVLVGQRFRGKAPIALMWKDLGGPPQANLSGVQLSLGASVVSVAVSHVLNGLARSAAEARRLQQSQQAYYENLARQA